MKSLTFAQFFAMPPGTVFGRATESTYQLSAGLYVKGESLPPDDDDMECVVFTDAIRNWEYGRWPEPEENPRFIYEADQEADEPFLVYEPTDLDRLATLIGRGSPGPVTHEDPIAPLIDRDAVAYAGRTADPSITLEEVRAALSSIEGSMSDVVIEDREERWEG